MSEIAVADVEYIQSQEEGNVIQFQEEQNEIQRQEEQNEIQDSPILNWIIGTRTVMSVVLLNTAIIVLTTLPSLADLSFRPQLFIIDYICSIYFVIEAIIKISVLGIRRYWSDHWNKLDLGVVVTTLPLLIEPFLPTGVAALSYTSFLRMGRFLRFLRTLRMIRFLRSGDDVSQSMQKLQAPVLTLLGLLGIYILLDMVTLPAWVADWHHRGFGFFFTVVGAWTVAVLYSVMHHSFLVPWAERTPDKVDDILLVIAKVGVGLAIWVIGLILAISNAGYDPSTILASLGIGGLAFALAAQHTVGNLLGGINIFVDRHIKVGQRVQFQGETGENIDGVVTQIGLRTTKIKTRYEGRMINIPNATVANQAVVNVDSEEARQTFAVYKLSPQTDSKKIEMALKLLKDIARNSKTTTGVAVTGFVQVSEVSRDIMLLYWIKAEASNLKTRSAINLEIIKVFEEHDIQFADKISYAYYKDVVI